MTVMAFGVFDTFHPGHQFFLKSALILSKGGSLIVVVARDLVVQQLKNKTPVHDEQQRVEMIKKCMPDATVILGDEEQGSYTVIKIHNPDIICLGHDQQALAHDLQARMADGTIPPCQITWATRKKYLIS